MLTTEYHVEVEILLKKLFDLYLVTKPLKDKYVCTSEALLLFDAVIKRFLTAKLRLSSNAAIIENIFRSRYH